MGMSAVISGVRNHVAAAATSTAAKEIALAWTTESMVIGRRRSVPCVVGEPGVPVPQVAGSP